VKPNDHAILNDDHLDTGMHAREAIARAEAWWEATGRKLMAATSGFDLATRARSGILSGRAWDALDKREKLHVVKVWHHTNIRRPDMLDKEPDDPFILGRAEKVR
jgi:hypothetical protein